MSVLKPLGRLRTDRRGSVLIETALVIGMLGFLAIGAVDFGAAWVRKGEIDNAIRAGMQFALARHPSTVDIMEGVVSIADVRQRIVDAADFIDTDPGAPALQVAFLCECPDGTSEMCSSAPGCAGGLRRTFVRATVRHEYDMIFAWPGLGRQMTLRGEGFVRLN